MDFAARANKVVDGRGVPKAARRLAIIRHAEEVTGNVALTCRYFGISRTAQTPERRCHRIDQDEFYKMLDGVVIDDAKICNDELLEWENFYNYNRPHGGSGRPDPLRAFTQKTKALA